ncbi:hypothetical protein L917_07874 [Phytophthora nicotianae]|uniref:Necrosis inducing protein NPP1 n=1 Tax=Phytophthora nicotianae TaxID=4792 RepID=W2LBS8_PHYNI|nr:hypothetical protein L915_08049 [Phytophthora nicotianae]ETL94095.1 hypothetical protein L917_07874 [Phytophthora nicotianae]ETM47337.1 hypothetical protein L914_07935 [Phytophthora nicotianae]
MNLLILTAALFAALVACATASIGHGKVQPFPQVMPVTISDKAAIKFKPQLFTPEYVCVPYPAVDAAGETTGGLKGTKRNDACKYAPLGSQVYGRARWYKDLWAIMYAWYFPNGFFMEFSSRRHDWKSVVVWIDNPEFETPKIAAVSMSKSDAKFTTNAKILPEYYAGYRIWGSETTAGVSNTSPRFQYVTDIGIANVQVSLEDGEYQDLTSGINSRTRLVLL